MYFIIPISLYKWISIIDCFQIWDFLVETMLQWAPLLLTFGLKGEDFSQKDLYKWNSEVKKNDYFK